MVAQVSYTQSYTPILDNVFVSALVAALPIVVLLGLLGILEVKAHLAALAGLVTSLGVAILVFGMPAGLALAAAGNGAAFGLFPIGWIIINAIFIYEITVKTGKFEIVKHTIANLANDRRIQVLLIAFCFGAFIEGAAGFGTPVAISGAMLLGLGFRPLHAAGLALIGNTAPVAYGALGSPIIALSTVTGLDLLTLSATVGRILPVFSLIVPFWIVWAMAGRRSMLEVWPACLTAGLSFAVAQFLMSNLHGPWLVDIAGSIFSMGALILLLRFWQPSTDWRFAHDDELAVGPDLIDDPADPPVTRRADTTVAQQEQQVTRREAMIAWMPWVLLTVFVFAWGLPQFKDLLNNISTVQVQVPLLHEAVTRMPPVVPEPEIEAAIYNFNWLSATGTGLLLSGILSGFLLGLRPPDLARFYLTTLSRLRFALLTIAAMLALGFVTRFAGTDATMGLAFARTGPLFAFFSPLLGWLGVALTGSDTSANVLFGNLQVITAQALGVSPLLAAAANSAGGVMGKMIDAQSIVVAGAATRQQGQEGEILRYVFWHSLVLAALVGVVVFLQAHVFTGIVPGS
jgi:lactate permease